MLELIGQAHEENLGVDRAQISKMVMNCLNRFPSPPQQAIVSMHVILDILTHGIPDFLTLGFRHTLSRAAEITVKIGSVDEPRRDDFDARVKGCEDAGS